MAKMNCHMELSGESLIKVKRDATIQVLYGRDKLDQFDPKCLYNKFCTEYKQLMSG
jgi:hypothetical protein